MLRPVIAILLATACAAPAAAQTSTDWLFQQKAATPATVKDVALTPAPAPQPAPATPAVRNDMAAAPPASTTPAVVTSALIPPASAPPPVTVIAAPPQLSPASPPLAAPVSTPTTPPPAAAAIAASTARVPPPPPGKGQIVFFRPPRFVGLAVFFSIREGDTKLTTLFNDSYAVVVADPGPHAYSSKSEVTNTIHVEIEEGETQYVMQTIGFGVVAPRPLLAPSDQEAFEQHQAMKRRAVGE